MSGEVSPRASIAAAVAGYEYQFLVAWYCALELLAENNNTVEIHVEKEGVDLVEDVVVMQSGRAGIYYQVKFAVNAANPITEDFFTGTSGTSQSFLQRLWTVFNDLKQKHRKPELVFYTNRPMDTTHPFLKFREAKTGYFGKELRRKLPDANKQARNAFAIWALHLSIKEDELLDMLDHVRIEFDQRSEKEFERSVADRMASYNLARDVNKGKDIVRQWVTSGVRRVDRNQFLAEIESNKLWSKSEAAMLVVQAIDYHLDAPKAHASVNWVDLFEGNDAQSRRRLKDTSLWNGRLTDELRAACLKIEETHKPRVIVRAQARLCTAFMIGYFLNPRRRCEIEIEHLDGIWTTATRSVDADVTTTFDGVGQGDDLAVGIQVVPRPSFATDVKAYLNAAELPVENFLHISTPNLSHKAIVSDAHALGFVERTIEIVEKHKGRCRNIHLFLAGPFDLAVFLGRLWNAMPATQLYEHLPPGPEYTPTFLIRA